VSANPASQECSGDGVRGPLSPRERAGVRGKGAIGLLYRVTTSIAPPDNLPNLSGFGRGRQRSGHAATLSLALAARGAAWHHHKVLPGISLPRSPIPHQRITPSIHLSYRSSSAPCYSAAMARDVTARRRWFGALLLLAALGMLICGQTVLQGRLGNLAFIAYWLVCFAFTSLAILIAFVDARALRHRVRQQQRDLFEATLRDIADEAKTKSRRPDRRPKKP
jgi:hypothetical protein